MVSCTPKNKYAVNYLSDNCNKNEKVQVIFFEDGFNENTIEVKIDKLNIFKEKITTDQRLGLAKYIELKKNYSDVFIKIDNTSFKLKNNLCKYTFINLANNTIYISYANKVYGYR